MSKVNFKMEEDCNINYGIVMCKKEFLLNSQAYLRNSDNKCYSSTSFYRTL